MSISDQIDVIKEELDEQDLDAVAGGLDDVVICNSGCIAATTRELA